MKNKNLEIIQSHPDYIKLINWFVENGVCSSDTDNHTDAAVSIIKTYTNTDTFRRFDFGDMPNSMAGKFMIDLIAKLSEDNIFPGHMTKYNPNTNN